MHTHVSVVITEDAANQALVSKIYLVSEHTHFCGLFLRFIYFTQLL